jgi:regulator of sigma E protease
VAAFTVGAPASIDSYPEYANRMQNPHIAIQYVEPASPAEKAGLKAGDTVLGFSSIAELQNAVDASKDKGITIHYKRGGTEYSKEVIAATSTLAVGRYVIGVDLDNVATLQLPFHLAFYESFRFTGFMIQTVAVGIYGLIAGIFNGTSKLSSVTGPIGIAGLVSDAAQLGFTYLMMFTAMISINLGVLNLVPFPALDGGRILFVLIEAVIRRPIKPLVANAINGIGFCLLILLMIVVTYQDVVTKLFK